MKKMKKKNFFVSMLLLALVVVPSAVFAAADKKAPIIYVYEPSGGAQISGSSVRVYGMATDQGGSGVRIVSVNGAPANSGTGNAVRYSKVISLPKKGTYGIIIIAIDFAGNRAEKRFTVTRMK